MLLETFLISIASAVFVVLTKMFLKKECKSKCCVEVKTL